MPDYTVLHESEKTGWSLVRRNDGELEMRKTIPYDGVLVHTTEPREYVSHRKSSVYNLTETQVIDSYEDETGVRVDLD
jgi:hypothetical protein